MDGERKLWVTPRIFAWGVFILVGAWIVFGSLLQETGYMTNASMSYLHFAHRFTQTGSVWIDDVFSPNGRSFVGSWPMGYPLILALVHYVIPSLFWVGKITNIILLGLSILAVGKIAKNATKLVYVPMILMPTWIIYAFTFSEALFICSSLWVIYFLITLGKSEGKVSHEIFLCLGLALGLSLAFASQYIGLFFVPIVIAVIFNIRRTHRRQAILLAVTLGIFLILAAGYLYYNLTVTGFLTGKARIHPPETVGQLFKMVLIGFGREFVPVLPIAFKSIPFCIVYWLIGLSVSISIGFSIFQRWYDATTRGNEMPLDFDVKVLVWSGVVYWIAIVGMRMTAYSDPLGFRQLWPGTLLVLIGLALWIGRNKLCAITARNGLITLVIMGLIGTAINMIFYNKKSYVAHIGPIIEKYQKVPPHSVAVFAPAEILFLRPDVQITIPEAYPICPKSETWDNYLSRMKSIPEGGIWIDYEEAPNYLSDETFKFDASVRGRFDKTDEVGVVKIPDKLPRR